MVSYFESPKTAKNTLCTEESLERSHRGANGQQSKQNNTSGVNIIIIISKTQKWWCSIILLDWFHQKKLPILLKLMEITRKYIPNAFFCAQMHSKFLTALAKLLKSITTCRILHWDLECHFLISFSKPCLKKMGFPVCYFYT